MILKKKKINFNISITSSSSQLGLSKEDNWCLIGLSFNKAGGNFHIERESLSRNEISFLIEEIKDFFINEAIRKKRIGFIKNHIVIYLEKKKNNYRLLNLKIIYHNHEKESDIISFEKEEINDLLMILEKFINEKKLVK